MVFILGFWVFICGLWVGGWLVISYDFLVSGIMVVGVPGWVNMELNFSRIVLDNFLSNLEAVGYGRSGGCGWVVRSIWLRLVVFLDSFLILGVLGLWLDVFPPVIY